MKKLSLIISLFALISCNQISKNVENSFENLNVKMDSVTLTKKQNIQYIFNEINSKNISNSDRENSEIIYSESLNFNSNVDSLITTLVKNLTDSKKEKVADNFNSLISNLRNKLNSISEFNTKNTVDSILSESKDLGLFPNVAIITELNNGKMENFKIAELLLQQINVKYQDSIKNKE